jgi:hypothetical protein
VNNDLYFDGKTFISVSRASELTGYTQDYLGQLCRGNRVPSRMVGRTWYVDQDAVVAHKQNPKSRKTKTTSKFDQKIEKKNIVEEFLQSQQKPEYKSPFTFEKDHSPILPALAKPAAYSTEHTQSKNVIAYAAVVVLLFCAVVSWINLLAPRATEITIAMLRSEMSREGFLSASVAASDAVHEKVSGTGLVVFPDPVGHDRAVASVESSFSDDAEVTFDRSGTSGVITPVFRSGNGSTSYAFVMVPLNKKTQ